MKSSTTRRFWKCYETLPSEVRKQAKVAYELFSRNPYYPSLHFKRIHATRPIFSVRIKIDYRALGFFEGDEITWFWIGSHREYETLIKKLRSAYGTKEGLLKLADLCQDLAAHPGQGHIHLDRDHMTSVEVTSESELGAIAIFDKK